MSNFPHLPTSRRVPADLNVGARWLNGEAMTVAAVFVALWLCQLLAFGGRTFLHGPDAVDDTLLVSLATSMSIDKWGLLSGMYLPNLLAGFPNWTNPNFHALYPLYFNWLGSDADLVDAWARMSLVVELHLALYGAGVCCLALAIGATRRSALFAGLAAAWFPAVMSSASWPQIVASLAWLPWVLACQASLLQTSNRKRQAAWAAGLVASATMLVYAQPAQNLALTIVGSALFWSFALLQALRDPILRVSILSSLGWLVLAGLGIALLTGGYLHGVVQFHAESIRWLGEIGGEIHGDQRLPVAAFVFHGLDASEAAALLHYSPEATKGGIGNPYVGAGLVAACLLAGWKLHGIQRAVALTALVATAFCFKASASLLYHLPVANKVREIVWWSCLAVPLATALGAVAIDRLPTAFKSDAPRQWRLVVIAVAVLMAAWLIASGAAGSAKSIIAGSISLLALLLCLTPVATRKRGVGTALAATFFLACVAVPASSNGPALISLSTVAQPMRAGFWADAQAMAPKIPDATNQFRVLVDASQFPEFQVFSKYLAASGIRTTRATASPMNYDKFRLLFFPSPTVQRLFGVRYTVVSPNARVDGDIPISARVAIRVTAPDALPRVFLVESGFEAVDSPVDALLSQTDPGLRFYLTREDAARLSALDSGPARVLPAETAENLPVRTSGQVTSSAGGLLVLNEDPSGRWRARINGRAVPAMRVNAFQTAFKVPAGHIRFEIDRPATLLQYRATRMPLRILSQAD